MKLIRIITSHLNEEDSAEVTRRRIKALFERLGKYRHERFFIDASAADGAAAPMLNFQPI